MRCCAAIGRAQSERDALETVRQWLLRGVLSAPHAFYVREGPRFVPVASCRLEPWPGFDAEGSLVRAIRRLGGPVTTVGSHRARRFLAGLDDTDRAALGSLGAIALVPFPHGEDLAAFLCVGGRFDTLDASWVVRVVSPLLARLESERKGRIRATPLRSRAGGGGPRP